MLSDVTKKYRLLYRLFLVVSILLNICPLATYTIKALVESNLTHQKVALSMTVFIVLIMTVVTLVQKVALRSRLWVILIGMYICLDNILTPLIIIACCQIVDELIVNPLAKAYKNRYIINKQIDRRQ